MDGWTYLPYNIFCGINRNFAGFGLDIKVHYLSVVDIRGC